MMKVSIITCYESNEERISFVCDACKKRKYTVNVITTNFSHIKKQKRDNIPDNYLAIETKPYSKNLSFARIKSHIEFAKNAFKVVELQTPDIIWLMAPANSLIREVNIYKKKYPLTKIIIDMIDMWPESLPFNISKKIPPLNIWGDIRRNNINCADALVTECDLYQETLAKEYHKKIHTIRWSRDDKDINPINCVSDDFLSLGYIGSINNIININLIDSIIRKANIPIVLHVIGEGEKKDKFINILSKSCEVVYHGGIRDKKAIANILSQCHAGINVYKENLYIGLTVKCIDYFENGLPIINNIKGDTWKMVNDYGVGINVDSSGNVDLRKIVELRKNSSFIFDFYKNNFTKDIFIEKCLQVIDEVLE